MLFPILYALLGGTLAAAGLVVYVVGNANLKPKKDKNNSSYFDNLVH